MLKAPYNFVELNHDVFIPDWGELISHDVPFSDGEDGVIEVELVNRTPLFIRNGAGASALEKEVWPAHIVRPDGTKAYFLPGSSIKGMLRAVLEILSFGRLDADYYNDELFGYREFGGNEKSNNSRYQDFMAQVGYGWLHYDKNSDQYLLDDCGDFKKDHCTIAISELEKILPKYKAVRECNAFKKAEVLGYPKVKGKTLVCSGYMGGNKMNPGKLNEYLFGNVKMPDVVVKENVIDRMRAVYKPSRDYYEPLCSKLRNGERIPVFFKRDTNGNGVIEIGLTRMFRHAYKFRMSDGIKQEDKAGHDLAQCIFGYTEKRSSLKGRVSIGNAFCSSGVPDNQLMAIRGVLGQPRASYYPLYLKQCDKDRFLTYDDVGVETAGRKRYRIHDDHMLTDLPQGNDNDKVKTEMKMLPAGLHFHFSMSLHNLRPEEVGALLSALTFHGMNGVYHNIGMAKSYGYGKLEVENVTLRGLTQDVKDYLRTFELCMSKFTMQSARQTMMWADTQQVKSLLSIASEHDNVNQLTMMELEEYEDGKKNTTRGELKENKVIPNTFVSKEEVLALEVELIESRLVALKPLEECSITECQNVAKLLGNVLCDYEEIQNRYGAGCSQSRIDELQNLKTAYIDAVLKKSSFNTPTAAAESFEKQVSKISSIGQLKSALDKWMKGKDRDVLTEEECQWLHVRLVEFWRGKSFKKKRKEWLVLGKGAWEMLAKRIPSNELLPAWYEECNNELTTKE